MAPAMLLVFAALVLAVIGLAFLVRARALASPVLTDTSTLGETHAAFWEAIAALPGPPRDKTWKWGTSSHASLIAKTGLSAFVRELHEQHGPVVAFLTGPKPDQVAVSVCDPTLLRSTTRMSSRPVQLFRFLEPLLGQDNLQVMNGSRAKETRRVLSSVVAPRHLAHSYPELTNLAMALMDELKAKSEAGTTVGLQMELLSFALRATLTVFAGTSTSAVALETFQTAYDTALSDTFDAQFAAAKLKADRLDSALTFLNDTVDFMIEVKRKHLIKHGPSPNREEEADLVEVLCTSNDPDTKWPYDQPKMRSLMLTYLLAAYHTSVVATTWALYLLTRHPDVQARVHQEVDDVLAGREPTVADLDKLVYTTQVIKESMRIYTPGPFAARVVEEPEGLTLGSHVLPPGCTVLYPLAALHMREELWPEPTRFDPDRFAPGKNIPPLAYAPFGLGPRICPGERMAWMEMRLVMALFMQRFAVELAGSPDHVVAEERFVLWARNDINVRLIPRERKAKTSSH